MYQFYDNELESLLMQLKLDKYPLLCSKMTEYFSRISAVAIMVKVFLTSYLYKFDFTVFVICLQNIISDRKESVFERILSKLQIAEKDKLLLVAARHLDAMQSQLPSVQAATGGECETHRTYILRKLAEVHERISEEIDNLQALKIDYLEN